MGPLFVGELDVDAGHAYQLVGDEAALTQLADQVDLGLDHPQGRHPRQPLDAALGEVPGSDGRHRCR